ncbi:unnamed protein product [Arctia plantaginis]|uniref:Conserved oligomeric Golgi complex subunit 7 n=1 Tax=Arctia plantaginis TaxID=874455 RepID=A0A8S0ZFZ2_ARCPL|nr:unnamed protein product [Arctia plantaginis]
MDLKSFGEESFDPKQWINKAWRSNSNQEKEIFVANTVTRLQLYMKQLTNSLDETTTQIVTSIPRIMQDASSLQLEGALLQQKLLSLEQKVQSVEEQTGHSIESLQKIDSLKSRLESAASALREADKWAALATSLEDILDSGVPTQGDKLAELCDQVAAMTASLEVLSDAPDYETKRLQLETLYNRLEAAVSPPLIEALTQMDAERTSRYVTLFSGMCRGVSVCRCWRRAAAQRLALAWRRLDAHSVAALGRLLAGEAARQVSVASCVASRALRGRARQAAGGRGGATGECRLVCRLTRTPWPRSAGCWRARRRDRLLAGEAARQVSVASCVASRALRGRARQAAGGRGGATGECRLVCRLVCRLTRTPWPRSAGCWRARRRDRLLAGEAARQVSVASCVASRALRGRARQAAGGRGGATGECRLVCRLVCRLTRTPWPRSAGCWRARRRDRLLAGEAARQVSVASCVASRALRGRARQAAGGRGGATGECRLVCRLTRTPWPRSAGCWRARRRDRLLAGEAARQVSVASCVASRALRGRARRAAGGRGGATGECRLVCRLTRTPWPRSAGCWRARRRDRLLAGEAARQVSVASCVASRALRGRARQAAGGRGGATGECRLVCRLTRTPWPRSAGCWRARRRDRLLAGEAARQVSVASCVASRALRGRARQAAGGRGGATDWLTNVLKSETPLAELVRLYTDLLLSLEPSPTKVVSANLKLCSNPDEGILLLTDLRTDIDDFVSCIQGVIDAPRQNKEILPPATLREFGRAVYGPLRELLPKYTEMQAQLLITNLQDPQLKQEDLLEQSRAILVVAERCEGWLSTAHSKAKKIAGDAMYAVYMPAVESFVSTLSNVISSHSRRIESTFLAAVTNSQATGVLCASFPASLLLESAVTTILDTLANGHKDEEIVNVDPLHDLPTLLLESEVRNRLSSFRDEPVASVAVLRRTKDQLRNLARAVLRNPVDLQLDKIPQLSVWSNNDALATDLPDFALSPQEYITEIGQYLMTLPQHLEMHLSEKQAPLQFLSDVCTHTCEVYAEKILNIRNMDALGTKRCLNDIVYLSSVVEDLGSAITPALRNLEKSLRAATPSQPAES